MSQAIQGLGFKPKGIFLKVMSKKENVRCPKCKGKGMVNRKTGKPAQIKMVKLPMDKKPGDYVLNIESGKMRRRRFEKETENNS